MDPLFYFYVSVIFLVICIPFCVWFLKVLNAEPTSRIPNVTIEETEEDENRTNEDNKKIEMDNVSREFFIV